MAEFPWFRVYSELLTERKIERIRRTTKLPRVVIRGVWVTLLAMANDSPQRGVLLWAEGVPVTTDELCDDLEMDRAELDALMAEFETLHMIGHQEEIIECTNFGKRQFKSDSSADRVKRYRARRKAQGMPENPGYNRAQILARDSSKCVYCGSTDNPCVDHAIPVQLGGTDHQDNLVCACKKCNSGKAGRTPEQAGYTFQSKAAETRYRSYLMDVTVTVTAGNGYCNGPDTETDAETDTETDDNAPSTSPSPSTPPTPAEIVFEKQFGPFVDAYDRQEIVNAVTESGEEKVIAAIKWARRNRIQQGVIQSICTAASRWQFSTGPPSDDGRGERTNAQLLADILDALPEQEQSSYG